MRGIEKIGLPASGHRGVFRPGFMDKETLWRLDCAFFAQGGKDALMVLADRHDRKVFAMDVSCVFPPDRDELKRQVAVKVYMCTVACRLKRVLTLRKSRAAGVWSVACRLKDKGLPVPEPVALLSKGRGLWRHQVVITEYISGTVTLEKFVRERIGAEGKRNLVRALARFTARLHAAGVYHGDFNAHNILVRPAAVSWAEPEIFLIDLDAVRSTRFLSLRRRIKNIDELGRNFLDLSVFSTADRMRFVRHYLSAYGRGGGGDTLRGLWAKVYARTAKRMARHGLSFFRGQGRLAGAAAGADAGAGLSGTLPEMICSGC